MPTSPRFKNLLLEREEAVRSCKKAIADYKDDLLPCPFCGGQAKINHDDELNVHYGFCVSCGTEGPKADEYPDPKPPTKYDSEKEAVNLWNRRAI